MSWGGGLNISCSTGHREFWNSSTEETDQISADLCFHHPTTPYWSGQEKWTGDTRYTDVNGIGDCRKFPFLYHSLGMRHVSKNNVLWDDIAQYLRHGCRRIVGVRGSEKEGWIITVAQDLEWTVGSLTLTGNTLCRLPNINSILAQAQSIMKCWRMLLLERKYILVSSCSCSQEHTHCSVWSYSQSCRYLFVHTNLLNSCLSFPTTVSKKYQSCGCFVKKNLLWHHLLLQVLFYGISSLTPCVQSFSLIQTWIVFLFLILYVFHV